MRIEFEALSRQIEPAFELEWPACSVLWQQVPPVDVFNIQGAVDVQIRQRSNQTGPRCDLAVHADVAPIYQSDHFADGAPLQLHVEIELACGPPGAMGGEAAEAARGAVGSRGLPEELHLPSAFNTVRRRDVEIGVHDVKHRLGVAKLEI